MFDFLIVSCALMLTYCGLLLFALCQLVQITRQGLTDDRPRKWRVALACALLSSAFALMMASISAGWAALYLLEATAPLALAVAFTLRKPRNWIAALWQLGAR